jgi:hypothetical protein
MCVSFTAPLLRISVIIFTCRRGSKTQFFFLRCLAFVVDIIIIVIIVIIITAIFHYFYAEILEVNPTTGDADHNDTKF